ncbi:MAG: calcium/sodium antiporter [Phycisphaerales bacterium]|nr:calcium/sodium antiporter [Phycisphaerales bacterium]
MTWMVPLLLVGGMVLLVAGAESLVRGAGALALRLGLSPLVVGLTVVAFGTSAPELAVSVSAALRGTADLCVGNVVGSNIANIALILGISAMIMPIAVHGSVVKREAPVMLGVSALLPALALLGAAGSGTLSGGSIARWEGMLFVAIGVAYTAFLIFMSKRERPEVVAAYAAGVVREEPLEVSSRRPLMVDLLLIGGGIGLLALGSDWFVDGAVAVARALGVSDLVVGLTVVAVGTSLPELATSVVAALRKQPDMSVGNIVGSNIANLAFILGLTATVTPLSISREVMVRDIPVMLAVSLLCIPLMHTGKRIARPEGLILFLIYIGYTAWLVVPALGSAP